MTPDQYTEAIENLNEKLRKSRAGKVDGVLLATGALIVVPLALWGVRHSAQTKKRKKLLKEGIHEFNTRYAQLWMRWNRRPQSTLSIERRPPNMDPNTLTSIGGGEAETMDVAEARVISDEGVADSQPQQAITSTYPTNFPPHLADVSISRRPGSRHGRRQFVPQAQPQQPHTTMMQQSHNELL